MADWTGASRTNYFEVKDIAAFKAEMAGYDVAVIESKFESDGTVGLYSISEDGSWPSQEHLPDQVEEVLEDVMSRAEEQDFNPADNARDLVSQAAELLGLELTEAEKNTAVDILESGEDEWPRDVVFHQELAKHLVDGEVAVFISAGHEKARYVSGYATAVRSDGEEVSLVLADIYDLAEQRLGKMPTLAQY